MSEIIHLVGSEVRISPSSQVVTLGSNATITCQHANLSANVVFLWHFLPTNSSGNFIVVFPDGVHFHPSINTLLITNITLSHIGWYSCEKVNPPNCFSNKSEVTLFGKFMCSCVCRCVSCMVRVLSAVVIAPLST